MTRTAALTFAGMWLALLFLLPTEPAATQLGAAIGKGFSAFGGTLVLWVPLFGTLSAIRWFRRKTH